MRKKLNRIKTRFSLSLSLSLFSSARRRTTEKNIFLCIVLFSSNRKNSNTNYLFLFFCSQNFRSISTTRGIANLNFLTHKVNDVRKRTERKIRSAKISRMTLVSMDKTVFSFVRSYRLDLSCYIKFFRGVPRSDQMH